MFTRLVFLSILIASAAQGQNNAQANSGGHIDGVVVNLLTGEPIRKATVILQGSFSSRPRGATGAPTVYTASADHDGRFAIDQITPGRYTVTADRPGFLPETYRVSGTSSIAIGPGQSLSSIRLQLTPQGSISGRVVDEDGDPITDVQLQVQRWSVINGVRRLTGVARGGEHVDEHGNFRMSGLDPGRYVLSASYNHFTRTFGQQAEGEKRYVTTFYPSALHPGEARSVPLGPGGEVSGIEIRLRKERMYTVSGRMVDAQTGELAKGLSISMHLEGDPSGGFSGTSNGQFSMTGLPGSYVLVPGRSGISDGSKGRSFHVPVTIVDHDLKDLIVHVEPSVTLTGSVLAEAGVAVESVTARGAATFHSRPSIVLMPRDGFGQEPPQPTKEDGSFELKELERARYKINVYGLPQGSYVKSMQFGSSAVAASTVDLANSGGVLQIVVSPHGGEIAGMVRNSKGDPLPEITLTIAPVSPDSTAQLTNARSDETGQYKIGGLAPGEYRVIAWEDYDYNQLSDPALLAAFDNVAVRVKVEADGHATADATIVTHDAMMAAAAKLP